MVGGLGSSAQHLAENFHDVILSSQQVGEVAQLLNFRGGEVISAEKCQMTAEEQRRHRELTEKIDRELHAKEAESRLSDGLSACVSMVDAKNAEDLAETSTFVQNAIGNVIKLQETSFDQVTSIFRSWETLLDVDASHFGFLIVRNVTFSLPAPISSIF